MVADWLQKLNKTVQNCTKTETRKERKVTNIAKIA